MPTQPEIPKLTHRGRRAGPPGPGLFTKVLAVLTGAAVLIGAIAVSVVLFAITLAALLVFGVYLWWKTRDLRKQLRSQLRNGDVIEGEVIREVRPNNETKR